MENLTSTFRFEPKASYPKNAIVVIYDLEGFSKFFNIPDIQDYIPGYLNTISETLNIAIFGGQEYWGNKERLNKLKLTLVYEKYLGDGALYLFTPPEGSSDFIQSQVGLLLNRLWNIKNSFQEIHDRCLAHAPIAELPKRIRFGIARGSIYELQTQKNKIAEYAGFPLNLASRLQSYCRDLGFIASARLGISDELISENEYMKVIAKSIKGFPREIVLVDKSEFKKLDEKVKSELFELMPK